MKNKLEKWEQTREMGKWNYIIKYGALGWGLTTAILFSIIIHREGTSFLVILGLSLVVFPPAGMAWAHSTWNYMENAHQKSKAS